MIAWVSFFSLPYLLISDHKPATNLPVSKPYESWPNNLFYFNSLLLVGVFYLNSEVLTPRLLLKKRVGWYLLGIAATVLASVFCSNVVKVYAFGHEEPSLLYASPKIIFPLITIFFLSLAYRMIVDSRQKQRQLQEQETAHLQTELKFLRSQVNPHFLLNVLNNMVSLARKKSDDLEPSLLKLSHLLQFMLYDADQQRITVGEEVEYLENYIALQKMRFGHTVAIRFQPPPPEMLGTLIAPMLLIPLVENAFKHGVNMAQQPEIDMNLSIENHTLYFVVSNTCAPKEQKDSGSGIGLNNLTRRLELLYPGQYEFHIDQQPSRFEARLTLHL